MDSLIEYNCPCCRPSGPSRFAPLSEIGYSLADLNGTAQMLRTGQERRGEDLSLVTDFELSLHRVVEGLKQLQDDLVAEPDAVEAWRRILLLLS